MKSAIETRLVAVGTHHKTGTIWLKKVFMEATRKLNLNRHQIRGPGAEKKIPKDERCVLVSWHSTFSDDLRSRPDLRGIHLIRDPRDVLISGTRYHLMAPAWREGWLYEPSKRFDGESYHSRLTSSSDWETQLLFEMDNMHRKTTEQMSRWRYDHTNWQELRYEVLIEDIDLSVFSKSVDFLGFQNEEKKVMIEAYWNNSLFGGLRKPADLITDVQVRNHIKSGQVDQWKTKLPKRVAEVYAEKFGNDLRKLGYAKDDRWIEQCQG